MMIHEHEVVLHNTNVPWYIILVGVFAGLFFALTATLIMYKCYKKKQPPDEEALSINSAIQKGIRESSYKQGSSQSLTGKKKASPGLGWRGKQNVAENKATSPGDGSQVGGDKSHAEKGKQSPSEKDKSLVEKCMNEKQAAKLGQLYFDVEYEEGKSILKITIIKAAALPAKNNSTTETADPYVKLHILPEKKQRVKTRVLRKTLHPVYDEVFSFYGIDPSQVNKLTLHFVILSFDRYSRDEIIGEVLYPLANADLGKKEEAICMNVSPRHIKMHSGGRGEILLSMCYQPAANRLTVVIMKARNLPKADVNGLSDPYVKVYLKSNGQRVDKKKSQVKKNTINPVFNQSFIFDIPQNDGLQNLELEFQVLEWDRMTKNDIIGRVELGLRFDGTAKKHWEEVINCPRKQIAEWHKLKE